MTEDAKEKPRLESELQKLTPEDAAKVRRLLEFTSRSSLGMNGEELRLAREAAGLSRMQAANLISEGGVLCYIETLESIESLQTHSLTPKAAYIVDKVYGLLQPAKEIKCQP